MKIQKKELKKYINEQVRLILETENQTSVEDLESEAGQIVTDPTTERQFMKTKCRQNKNYNSCRKSYLLTDGEIEYLDWLAKKIFLYSEEYDEYPIEDLEDENIYILDNDYGELEMKLVHEIICSEDGVSIRGKSAIDLITNSKYKIINVLEETYTNVAEIYMKYHEE